MAQKNENGMQKMGAYAFIGGIALAVILGMVPSLQSGLLVAVLAALGLVVAILNITDKEVTGYLTANIAVMLGANAFNATIALIAGTANLGFIANIVQAVTGNLVFFVAPGAVLIALKQIYAMARDQ